MILFRNAACVLAVLCTFACAAQPAPQIAAASDLQFALDEIVAAYKSETGGTVKTVYGSSGNFRQQIAQGAPFQMFLSADESYVLALANEGRTMDSGTPYAIGRIVLFAPHSSKLKPDPALKSLADALVQGQLHKFAIANPEHAPYGRAAKEALIKAGLWEKLQPKLVLGENVSQAAQFAATAGIQGGIFAYSLALSPQVAALGTYALIPESAHQPLRQRMALLKNAGTEAQRFYRYLQQPSARAIFKRFGFALPGG